MLHKQVTCNIIVKDHDMHIFPHNIFLLLTKRMDVFNSKYTLV